MTILNIILGVIVLAAILGLVNEHECEYCGNSRGRKLSSGNYVCGKCVVEEYLKMIE